MPGKAISKVIKKLIIEAIDAGESAYKVAERFHVNIASVSRIYKKWRKKRTVERKKGSGRPRKTTQRQNWLLIRLFKIDLFKTAVDVQDYARDHGCVPKLNLTDPSTVWIRTVQLRNAPHMGVAMSARATRRILVRAGLCARRPAKKPFIFTKNRKVHLVCAIDHKD
jgi:transposase